RVAHTQDNVALALGGIKNTFAIAEFAFWWQQCAHFILRKIKHRNRNDTLGNLLTICPNILYGSSAHAARNSAQTLDARAIERDRVGHKFVPIDARAHLENDSPSCGTLVNSGDPHLHNESIPSPV